MEQEDLIKALRRVVLILQGATLVVVLMIGFIWLLTTPFGRELLTPDPTEAIAQSEEEPAPEIVDDIHVATGLIAGEGLQLVITNCTGCHSAKLITQNRMDSGTWATTIKWMQQTQGLWDLGENTDAIVQYLATNYAPTKKGRRAQLTDIEWYDLD